MRWYRQWGANPRGDPEDPTRCVAPVADGGRSPLSRQCSKPRGRGMQGDLCGTHARVEAKYGRGSLWIPEDSGRPKRSGE
jgi:hypothetical protein